MAEKPTLFIDTRKLRAALDVIDSEFGPRGARSLMSRVARHFRDRVRSRITSQGNGSWAPLSNWTRARTGRRKALITLRNRIKAKWDSESAQVYFDSPSSEWDISDHHQGFTSPAVKGKRMAWRLTNPAAIRWRGSKVSITSRKASRIPARDVWSSDAKVKREVNTILDDFATQVEAKINGVG